MSAIRGAWLSLVVVGLLAGCKSEYVPVENNPTEKAAPFILLQADRTLAGPTAYPVPADVAKVGTYPPETKSGSGYFYDEVLEYRVWLHPEKGAEKKNGAHDYFAAFAQYERAKAFSQSHAGAEEPLVLVRQHEWLDEPKPGEYIPESGERLTEWQVKWLAGSKRGPNSIKDFLKHPRPAQIEADEE